jgi:hypothetical protein
MLIVRKFKRWIIILACVGMVLAGYAGVTVWLDPPVEYYGQWMRQHELYEQVKIPTFCVQNPVTDWYRQLARIFPAPSSFICFNSDAEARLWMQQNIH